MMPPSGVTVSQTLTAVVLTPAVLCCAVSCPPSSQQPLSETITSLHDAAKWGDREAVERLLNEGADVNGVVSDVLGFCWRGGGSMGGG
jgi:hypothetical protein